MDSSERKEEKRHMQKEPKNSTKPQNNKEMQMRE